MTRRRSLLSAAVAAVLVLVGAGCAGDEPEADTPADPNAPATTIDIPADRLVDETGKQRVEVSVVDNTFEPSYLVVSPGTEIVFRNEGRNQHNVVPVETGRFDEIPTADFGPGKVGSITVDGEGDIPYYCSIHGTKKLNGQSGVIRIG